MTDRPWKRTERRVAELLGGVRVPVSGRGRGDQPDVEHPLLSIEVKSRRSLPSWLFNALDQAEAAARGEQIPVVILHQTGVRYADSLVLIRLESLVTLLAELKPTERKDQTS